ncbi:acyl-CoA dehydratase activase [Candidatus Solincola tengchongensis]|uniref:acyl-CoA dehydratase activase n=1 Tax=Candidatus Solincola tengchongensis TaxID=2900693 RepID=UPI00257FC735|nr:acyl-CoA dehydratase activase [Candidatus Solincola tengchongensis]
MKALGCDIGSLFSKAVVMDGETVLAWKIMETTGNIAGEVDGLVEEVCGEAGVSRHNLDGIVATGSGAEFLRDADFLEDELACIAWAARCFLPEIELVVDIGGQSITSMLLDPEGEVLDFMRNDKCASGSGRFLEVMAAALGIPVERIDEEAARARKRVPISSQCGVFVESEVITHVNNGESPQDIVAGLCDAVARIVTSQARRFGSGNSYTFTGGVARVRTVVDLVRERMEGEYQPFPLDPMLAAAVGAALLVEAS